MIKGIIQIIIAIILTIGIGIIADKYFNVFGKDVIKETVIEHNIDSTYIISLKDSIATLMNNFANQKPKIIKVYINSDSLISVDASLKASKAFSYNKTLTIRDSVLNMTFDASVTGIDSVFKFDNKLAILKSIDVAIKNIDYSVKVKEDNHYDKKNERFSLLFGGGIFVSNYESELLIDQEISIGAIISNKHSIDVSYYIGTSKGFGFTYKYKLFSF